MNEKIIKWFKLLIKQLEFYVTAKTKKDKLIYSFKLRSIKKSLDIIKNIEFNIKAGSDLKDYKNIGPGTMDRIDEILNTNKLSEINDADITKKHLYYIEELMKVFGIGRKIAYDLYTNHNIKSIHDLKKAIHNNTVHLPESIIKGIAYVDLIDNKIPRAEIDKINNYLIKVGTKLDTCMEIRICGSYRREKLTSGDIDLLISHSNIKTIDQVNKSDLMQKFIKKLVDVEFIIDSLTSDNVHTKYMGVCRLNKSYPIRRIDIRYISQDSYYTALLHATGSDSFNKKMRMVALSMGYSLNEYRLLDENKKKFIINSEKDIFNYLNMEYVHPKERI